MRDARINLIFEGSSEIMRLFLAREALDPHLKIAGAALDSRLRKGRRAAAALKALGFYAHWYPGLLLPRAGAPADFTPGLKPALRYVANTSRQLARRLFHAMAKHGPRLERRQLTLGRIVDIGTELFAITATALYADALVKSGARGPVESDLAAHPSSEVEQLAVGFIAGAQARIASRFNALAHDAEDRRNYQLTQSILEGKHRYLRRGIVE
jgi:hypothetical protein